jgi:hypothetical protein
MDYTGIVAIGNDFLNRTQIAQQRTETWDYMQLKIFCTMKEMDIRLKRKLIELEKNLCKLYI